MQQSATRTGWGIQRGCVEMSEGGSERFEEDVEECEECGGEIDFREATAYYKTADERFWHEDCHDPTEKLDRVEEIRHDLIRQIIPEGCFDGLSDDFYYRLDSIQDDLDEAVRKERLRQDQDLVTDGGRVEVDTEQCPNCGEEANHTEDGDHRICWECGKRWSA